VVGVVVVVLWALLGPAASEGASVEIGPEADLCAEINALAPGDELVLRPGEYRGPCTIRRGGGPGAPTVIRAKDVADRPRIVYGGATANVLDVKADHVTIRGLAFGPTQRNVDGIRIFSRAGVTVEDCEFSGLGGIAVVANSTSGRGIAEPHPHGARAGRMGLAFSGMCTYVVRRGGTCDGTVQSQTRKMDVVVRSELEGLSREDSEAARSLSRHLARADREREVQPLRAR